MSSKPNVRFLDRTTPPHILTLVLLAGISAMTMSVFLPSLPQMAIDLETDYSVMQLSVSLYLAFTAILQILIGPISDRFGRRPVILGAFAIFLAATIGCYFATSIGVFLAFRMLQAAIAVGMVLSRAIVRDMVPQDQAASMIGYVTMGMSLVPMFAPMIGGTLDTLFDWHATFIFLMLSGLGIFALIYFDLGETSLTTGTSFKRQIKQYPELFMAQRFWGYALAAAFASGSFFAFLGGAPYVASEVYGQPPSITGIFFGAPAVGYFTGNLITGRLAVRIGINRLMLWGSIVLCVSMALSVLITLIGFGSVWSFFAFCTFVGLGNGLVLPNATAGLLSVRPHLAGTASGVGGAIMIGGGAAMAALAGALLKLGGGSLPLQWIMLVCAILSLIAILWVLRRARIVAA